jgi:hypothetical protein
MDAKKTSQAIAAWGILPQLEYFIMWCADYLANQMSSTGLSPASYSPPQNKLCNHSSANTAKVPFNTNCSGVLAKFKSELAESVVIFL